MLARVNFFVLGIALLSSPVNAEPVEIRVVTTNNVEATSGLIILNPVVTSGEAMPSIKREVSVPGSFVLDLPHRSTWQLSISATGYWAPPTLIKSSTPQTIEILPTASVQGLFALDQQQKPTELTVRFKVVDQSTLVGATATVACDLAWPRWSCEIPRTTLDLKLYATGFVPFYFWSRHIKDNLNLGLLALEKGPSLAGVIELESGELTKDCQIRLVPLASSASQPGERQRVREGKGHHVRPDAAGFFQLIDFEPGSYELVAKQANASGRWPQPLTIRPESAVELPAPLVLRRPLEMEVAIQPTTDPLGGAWRMLLIKMPEVEAVARGPTDEVGIWRQEPLEAGTYRLMVSDSSGQQIHFEKIELNQDERRFEIKLPTVLVDGTVALGDQPLAARLRFYSRGQPVSISMEADEEGAFFGVLPRAGHWFLSVDHDEPPISRKVALEVAPGANGVARVEVQLPRTFIDGRVLGLNGQPESQARVMLFPVDVREDVSTARVDDQGEFSFEGHEPGRYQLQAFALDGSLSSSPLVEGELGENNPWTSVELTIQKTRTLRGRLLSTTTGRPVSLAEVHFEPAADGPAMNIRPDVSSDADGRFSLQIPQGIATLQITVLAAGHLLHRSLVNVTEEEQDLLLTAEIGGTLKLPTTSLDGDWRPALYIGQGDPISIFLLRRWAEINAVSLTRDVITVAQMPAGVYAYCQVRTGDTAPLAHEAFRSESCQQGILLAGSELHFVAEERSKKGDHS